MSKLQQLPNGAWIDLTTVIAIRPLPTQINGLGGTHRARVVIHTTIGLEIVTANDDEHAITLANEYAKLVNNVT